MLLDYPFQASLCRKAFFHCALQDFCRLIVLKIRSTSLEVMTQMKDPIETKLSISFNPCSFYRVGGTGGAVSAIAPPISIGLV